MNDMDTGVIQENLAEVVKELRDLRIKIGTDYNYTFKYSSIHVMCNEVYRESIKAVFDNYDLTVEFLTWGRT